ncbi:SH3 domain-containing protein [uncultured Thalassospira sp.]|uniref:SH3 domain-containing protein n=1 Tax=uncultured Thalassospira sp. TaxID=404382 RepID=UPI0030DA45F0|tara:strand:- start:7030 stop:8187 length:1158 start_codon:yes stop_codon:yes gene_type:complete
MNVVSKRILVLMVSTSLLSGCVTPGTMGKYDDKTDACYAERQPLVSIEKKFNESLVTGAVVGALVGGIAGALLGGKKNRTGGVLVGAGVGLLTGLAAGYLQGKQQKGLSQQQILQEINSDTSTDKLRLSQTTGVVKKLTDCRFAQLQRVRNGLEANYLTKEQATSELKKIREQMAIDQKLIQGILDDSEKRLDAYASAEAQTRQVEKSMVVNTSAVPTWIPPEDRKPGAVESDAVTETLYALGNTNVRSGSSTSSSVLGSLRKNQKVEVIGRAKDAPEWYEISFKDQRAFVHGSRLTSNKVEGVKDPVTVAERPLQQTQGLQDPVLVGTTTGMNPHEQAVVAQAEVAAVSETRYKQLAAEIDDIGLVGGLDLLLLGPNGQQRAQA